jgi:group I intron endonuclease
MELPSYINGHVYLITNNINNKQYVGQTKTYQWRSTKNNWIAYGYQERFNQHKRNTNNYEKYGRCRALNSAMKKYGTDNFKIDLLEECSIDSLDELETFYIMNLSTLAPNGYNLETGGNENKTASAETRQLQSEMRKIYYKSDQGKSFIMQHSKFLSEYNASNNDKKKINKYISREITRILIADCPNERTIYLYIYCEDDPKKQNKIRFKYTNVDVALHRAKEIALIIAKDPTKITSNNIQL